MEVRFSIGRLLSISNGNHNFYSEFSPTPNISGITQAYSVRTLELLMLEYLSDSWPQNTGTPWQMISGLLFHHHVLSMESAQSLSVEVPISPHSCWKYTMHTNKTCDSDLSLIQVTFLVSQILVTMYNNSTPPLFQTCDIYFFQNLSWWIAWLQKIWLNLIFFLRFSFLPFILTIHVTLAWFSRWKHETVNTANCLEVKPLHSPDED